MSNVKIDQIDKLAYDLYLYAVNTEKNISSRYVNNIDYFVEVHRKNRIYNDYYYNLAYKKIRKIKIEKIENSCLE